MNQIRSFRRTWDNRRRFPLRVTLVAAMLGLVTVALVVIGVVGSSLLQRYLLDRVDSQLRTTANQIIQRQGSVGQNSEGQIGVYPGGGLYAAATDGTGNFIGNPVILPLQSPPPAPRLPAVTTAAVVRHGGN